MDVALCSYEWLDWDKAPKYLDEYVVRKIPTLNLAWLSAVMLMLFMMLMVMVMVMVIFMLMLMLFWSSVEER